MLRHMVMRRLPVGLAVPVVLVVAACGAQGQEAESRGEAVVERNESEGCKTQETSRLIDFLGARGHDSPEDAARASAHSGSASPGTAEAGWYVYEREGDKALLAPRSGPVRLEAHNSAEAGGWVVTAWMRCR